MERNLIQLPESFLNNPIAHRGLHNCGDLMGIGNGPENSREAIMHAIKLGFGVEIDVRFSIILKYDNEFKENRSIILRIE